MLGDKMPPFESLAVVLVAFTLLVLGISIGTWVVVGKLLKKPEQRRKALKEISKQSDDER